MFLEILKTIGFGLFVNSSYDLMKNDISLNKIYICVGSLLMVALSYTLEKRNRKWMDK